MPGGGSGCGNLFTRRGEPAGPGEGHGRTGVAGVAREEFRDVLTTRVQLSGPKSP